MSRVILIEVSLIVNGIFPFFRDAVNLSVHELVNSPGGGDTDVSDSHESSVWQSHSSRLKLFNNRRIIVSTIEKDITRHVWHQNFEFLSVNIGEAIINLTKNSLLAGQFMEVISSGACIVPVLKLSYESVDVKFCAE
jgi:hypothetical protein